MRISLITPALPAARNGNAHTAVRWARFLRADGHRVNLATAWDGTPADLMVALHARRSAASIRRFAEAHPARPLIVVLTGTDLYRDIHVDAEAQQSLQDATRLVVLQARGPDELPPCWRAKTRVIYQSAPSLKPQPRPRRSFDICVVAHLREEKDPLRAAEASLCLPATSRIRIWHVGAALTPAMAMAAARCAAEFPRWHWLGELAPGATRQRIAHSHLLVNSSRMEGGAHAILEAVTAATPVLASRIPGNEGMLGLDYAGFFATGDTEALADCLHRAETDLAWYRGLAEQCAVRAPLFAPAIERAAIKQLIIETSFSS